MGALVALLIAAAVPLLATPVAAAGVDIISTYAGTGTAGYSGDGGPANNAALNEPTRVAVDSAGVLYIADLNNHRVRRVLPDGSMSTYAGTGTAGFSGDGGLAVSAKLARPVGLALDSAGNLYIADRDNERIRMVTPGGIITTVAGNGTAGFSGDGGLATSAALNGPAGVAVDANGNLFIADRYNQRVRRVLPGGIMTTFAGNGLAGSTGDGGPATSARLNHPTDVVARGDGRVYIAERHGNRVRRVEVTGTIITLAGTGTAGYSGDGGPATAAELNGPYGLGLDAAGSVYIAEIHNGTVRKVLAGVGTITTYAGNGSAGFSGDGGPATSATMNTTADIAFGPSGDAYIADQGNHRVRRVTVNAPPSMPTQDAPADDHVFQPGDQQTFRVTASDGDGHPYTTTVEVTETSTNFTTTFTLPTTASGSQASGEPPSPFGPGIYTWRARATDGFAFGPWSGSLDFTVLGEPGNVSASPPAQAQTVGSEAVLEITVTDDSNNPSPAAPISVSRSGANPQEAQGFITNGLGVYEYRYVGSNVGTDVIEVASTVGDTAHATVVWAPDPDPLGYPSDDCTTGNLVGGYVGETYVSVRVQANPAQPGEQWVCVVGQDASTHHGGKLVLGATPGSVSPDVGVDTTQAAAESCLPIGQRVESGSFAGGNPFFIDVAPNPNGSTGAWACVRVASVFVRVRVTAQTPVTANFLTDEPQPRLYGEEVMTGLYSGTCQAAGGTRHLNLKVGDQLVALYTSEDGTQQDVCVRAGPQGARVRVDSGATPTPDYDIGASRDSSCPWELISLGGGGTQVYMVDPFDPQLPAGVCVMAAGSTHRVTVILGDGEGGEPVDVDQDPA